MPTPISCRMTSPRLKPPAWISTRLRMLVCAAQVRPPHPAGLVEMGEGAFEQLAAVSQQPLAARAADAPTIGVDGVARVRLVRPVASAAVRLGDVAADAHCVRDRHDRIAVIALVGDDLVGATGLPSASVT